MLWARHMSTTCLELHTCFVCALGAKIKVACLSRCRAIFSRWHLHSGTGHPQRDILDMLHLWGCHRLLCHAQPHRLFFSNWEQWLFPHCPCASPLRLSSLTVGSRWLSASILLSPTAETFVHLPSPASRSLLRQLIFKLPLVQGYCWHVPKARRPSPCPQQGFVLLGSPGEVSPSLCRGLSHAVPWRCSSIPEAFPGHRSRQSHAAWSRGALPLAPGRAGLSARLPALLPPLPFTCVFLRLEGSRPAPIPCVLLIS